VDFILFLLQWLVDVCTVEDPLSSRERIATKCKKTGMKLQKYALNACSDAVGAEAELRLFTPFCNEQ
jgi:hypothetical protein